MASTKKKHRRTSHGAQVRTRGLAERVHSVETALARELPDFSAGDTIRVHVRIKEGEKERIQIFEGTVIGRFNRGAGKSFIVRKMSHGVGVERIFLDCSPKIQKVELIQHGKVRRAKLYYLRKLEGRAAKIEREIESGGADSAPAAQATVKGPTTKQ